MPQPRGSISCLIPLKWRFNGLFNQGFCFLGRQVLRLSLRLCAGPGPGFSLIHFIENAFQMLNQSGFFLFPLLDNLLLFLLRTEKGF
jgi:hypothetical protein